MNQTEIYKNMNRGQWEINIQQALIFNGIPDDHKCICRAATDQRSYEENKANNAAIVSAVNNTYGKGINPEGVWKIKTGLETIQKICEAGNHTSIEGKRMIQEIIKEALTAAKLNP